MKKVFLSLFSLLMLVILIGMSKNNIALFADYDTGHNEYVSITFDDEYNHLLASMSADEKNSSLKRVKWAFFGWQQTYNNSGVIGHYVGKTIFSRSNRTDKEISFNYQSQVKSTEETSITSEGTIGGSVNAKGKTLNGGLEGKIRKTIGTATEIQNTEKTSFKVTIKPGYKVSMIAKGDVRVNNGAAKYYFLGITFKKGHWEILDVVSEYYELVEEAI